MVVFSAWAAHCQTFLAATAVLKQCAAQTMAV
jgi:hypothetical protein